MLTILAISVANKRIFHKFGVGLVYTGNIRPDKATK